MGQILNKTFSRRNFKTGGEIDTLLLLQNWERIVGEKLSKVSLPQRISRKTLYIIVNHSAYAHHLNQVAEPIKQKLDQIYPQYRNKIDHLRFIFSEKSFQDIQVSQKFHLGKKKTHKSLEDFNIHDPKFKNLKIKADQLFSDIDEELRASLISIYIQKHMN